MGVLDGWISTDVVLGIGLSHAGVEDVRADARVVWEGKTVFFVRLVHHRHGMVALLDLLMVAAAGWSSSLI